MEQSLAKHTLLKVSRGTLLICFSYYNMERDSLYSVSSRVSFEASEDGRSAAALCQQETSSVSAQEMCDGEYESWIVGLNCVYGSMLTVFTLSPALIVSPFVWMLVLLSYILPWATVGCHIWQSSRSSRLSYVFSALKHREYEALRGYFLYAGLFVRFS